MLNPMDVATLAIAPRRILIADDGLMDRVRAVLSSPVDWVPAESTAEMWPQFDVEVIAQGKLASAFTPDPAAPIGLVPPQLIISSSRNAEHFGRASCPS